jgi:hypothetical protein
VDTGQGAKTGEAKEEKTPSLSPSKILEERTRGVYNGGTDVKYHGSVRSIEWRKGVASKKKILLKRGIGRQKTGKRQVLDLKFSQTRAST